ncbi:MAG: PEP-CTERM sorting domain-containing protein [Janthinobacterium lividum]
MIRWLLLAAIALSASTPASAGLFGTSVELNDFYPDTTSLLFREGTTTVGLGVEYKSLYDHSANDMQFDIANQFIRLDYTGAGTYFANTSFNGFSFTFLGPAIPTGFTLISSSDFNPASVSLIGRVLLLNYAGVMMPGNADKGTFSGIDLQFDPNVKPETTLMGSSVKVDWLYPDDSTQIHTASAVVDSGTEFTDKPSEFSPFTIDLTADKIIFKANGDASSFFPSAFNGFRFMFSDAVPTSAAFDKLSDFGPFSFSLVGNILLLNFTGVNYPAYGSSIFDLGFGAAAVPEASTWAMLVAGFGVMGVAIRRRRHTLEGAASSTA